MPTLKRLKNLGVLYTTQFAVLDDGETVGGVTVGIDTRAPGNVYVMGLHLEKPGMAFAVARQLRAAYPEVDEFWAYQQKYGEYRKFKLPRLADNT